MKKFSTGGPWGLGLLLFAFAAGAYGAAYVAPTPQSEVPAALAFLSMYVPLWCWGALWLVAAARSIWSAVHPPQTRVDAVPLIVITHLWGSAYMVWWLYEGLWLGDWNREWRGWILFSGLSTLLIIWSRLVNPPIVSGTVRVE